jgi:hypothetical protein
MKRKLLSVPKWAAFVTFAVTTAVLGFSCGSGSSNPFPTAKTPTPTVSGNVRQADAICAAPTLFNSGRPLSFSELATAGNMSFELRELHFRDVILRSPGSVDDVELAYRTEMRMANTAGTLTPVNQVVCNQQNRPSRRGQQLSRTTIPVVGDLHLPSMRITVYDQASAESDNYNMPRISEITVSNGNYFSFNNQNIGAYRQVRTISQYMNLLRYRMLYEKVELREMGDGWIGVYAEKTFGVEKSQLLILLARAN